ncbi:tyrosine serine phosphatase [Micractinium conductrix]|uniref:Tyrosine serine phosphatase n=1 Tax=Micractinium conductrix TaxID=554055 RepID=A0A2P6VGE1_9CHLO|nr:tyrosine serine phosphatase [Micractinium conductrix]|eukprot:PSC73159.1 tyrosine serine phosphatase [Micractinium conductrix]
MAAAGVANGQPTAVQPAADASKGSEQPYHETGAALLADEPAAPSVSDAAARAVEKAAGANFRDLSSVSPSIILSGRVYRSSQVVSVRELAGLGVSAILDLRQPPVGCKLEQDNLWGALRRGVRRGINWLASWVDGDRYEQWREHGGPLAPPPPCHRCTETTCGAYGIPARVYHVDLLPTGVSLRILWELPRGLQARVLWAAARRKHPEPIVAGAVADPQVMGYLKLYILLLERASRRLADAVRLAADPDNLPLLVHCIHGKDRTGLVAMLLLLLCGVERGAVVRDYALSEALLREGREKRQLLGLPEHLTTDQIIASAAAVMDSTINHLEGRYGSARNYLKAIGLTDAELTAIVRNLTAADAPLPAAVERAARACGAD